MAQDASAVLREWLDDENRIREQMSAGVGTEPMAHAQIATLSGIDFFNAMFDGRLPGAPIGKTLDFLPVRIEPGLAVFQGEPKAAHYNPLGTVHGGWFATLLDSALACAVHSKLPPGRAYTTLELKINLVRALTADVKRVRAEGKIIHLGNQTATAEARLLGPDGRLYGHGTTTCLVFARQAP